MTRPTRVAVLGFWHVHAEGYAAEVREATGAELAAVWDSEEDRGREGAELVGAPFRADLDELLGSDDIDAVVITAETNAHTDVISRALAAGKHVFTEKLLAPTVEECERLLQQAEDAGLALVVSLPFLAERMTSGVRELVDSGALGQLTYVRVRMAHDGWVHGWLPERFADPVTAIGGALSDLGCHPLYLVQHLLGAEPSSVGATYTRVTGRNVEDNAVVTLAYDDGAIGVAEASFVTTPGAFALEVRGTEGSLLYGFGREALIGKGGSLGEQWTEVELPAPAETPMAQWLRRIRTGDADAGNGAAAVALTRLVQTANRAAATSTALPYA